MTPAQHPTPPSKSIDRSRRGFIAALAAAAAWPAAVRAADTGPDLRIRTITAGIELEHAGDGAAIDRALTFLGRAREAYAAAGYVVQTTRLATQPLAEYLPGWAAPAGIAALQGLDRRAADAGMPFSIGPALTAPGHDPGFGPAAAALVQATGNLNFAAQVASETHGVHHGACRSAAEAIAAIAASGNGGEGNFRFAATAFCPPGTPFFPAAWHRGPAAFAIGLETPRLLTRAFEGSTGPEDAMARLRELLNAQLRPIEEFALELAQQTGWRYLGIDTSPAPSLESSIGEAIETLTGAPFGAPSTLSACAAITTTVQDLDVTTCGYSGLMLPILEDTVLARRADEGRFGVPELLLYSSVCGTGLDVVPLPGEVPVAQLAATITDVAALALRYRKALSARLFPAPGKSVGERVTFDNPYLTGARVMQPG